MVDRYELEVGTAKRERVAHLEDLRFERFGVRAVELHFGSSHFGLVVS